MGLAGRREREKQARRESIMRAAQQIAVRDGFNAMTMDAVAEAAELSKGALYLYFENKDALGAAKAFDELQGMQAELPAQIADAKNGLDAIRKLLTYYANFVAERPHLFRFMLGWLSETQPMDDRSEVFQEYRQRVGL